MNGIRDGDSPCFPDDPAPCGGGAGIWNTPSGSVHVVRSVIAANAFAVMNPDVAYPQIGPDCAGVLLSDGYNLVEDTSDCTLQPSPVSGHRSSTDLVGLSAGLGPLQDDGTAGNAHYSPLSWSPLIDAATRAHGICAPFDQIGEHRVDGDGDGKPECDIGAIEFQGASP